MLPEDILRYEYLIDSGCRTEPSGELHRRAEEIVAVFDRLAAIKADTNVNGFRRSAVIAGEFALDANGTANGGVRRNERGHDPVAGMLHFPTLALCQATAHDRIMRSHQFRSHAVAKA